jgi:hypothetical protein
VISGKGSVGGALNRRASRRAAPLGRSGGQMSVTSTELATGYEISGDGWNAPLESENQIFGVQFELLQAHLFKLLVFGEVRLLEQFFQTLSVAAMFCMQAINLLTQRGNLYFVHQAPPVFGYL